MALSMRQEMEIWSSGRCKCPLCGKFRKPQDFPDQPPAAHWGDSTMQIRMSLLPGCYKCVKVESPNAGVNRRTVALSPGVRLDDLLGDGDAK